MSKKYEIESVEHLEIMEEKCGVALNGVYAEYEIRDKKTKYLNVNGEIQAVNGSTIDNDLDIVVMAYNSSGKVIATSEEYIEKEKFFCISPFSMWTEVADEPVKVRIYPKIS